MISWIADRIRAGVTSIKDHQQLFLTLFLMIAIPAAFIYTGSMFLEVSMENRERLEKERIGGMHDAFLPFIEVFLDSPEVLNYQIRQLAAQSPDIVGFHVVVPEGSAFRIVASANEELVGQLDDQSVDFYRASGLHPDNSLIFETEQAGARHWRAYRPIFNENNQPVAFLYTNYSMESLDAVFESRVFRAYIFLGVIIILILLLLYNHARIIDYVALYNKLKKVDQMKDDFLSVAAHELKTPLSAIRGYASLVGEEKNVSDRGKQNLEKIDQLVGSLTALVNDLLDVSRIQQGRLKMELTKINPFSIIEDVTSKLIHQAEEKNVSLSVVDESGGTMIKADEARLSQVLINLVGNSIKYTEEGEVKIRTTKEHDDYVIRIEDTGIGISAEDRERLFSKFFRIQSEETQNIRGTGLGMWISRRLVEEMGGTIGIESIKDVGTHMIVKFPVER